MKIKALFMSGD